MDAYLLISLLCGLTLLSYGFDLLAKKIKVPAVLMLIGAGIGGRILLDSVDFQLPGLMTLLPTLGIIGLALIVLEGGLDLEIRRSKLPDIKNSFWTALAILALSVAGIGTFIHFWFHAPWKAAILNAIPMSVVSSAIAIPSVGHLASDKKDRLIYETTFADILGIMLFNFVVASHGFTGETFWHISLNTLLTVGVSVLACVGLLFLIGRITTHVKFFLIIASLMGVFALGKLFHLSTLLLVFLFGLLLNNLNRFLKGDFWSQVFRKEAIESELPLFRTITIESAFLVRTFFFLIFGYSINLVELAQPDMIVTGVIILVVFLLVRMLVLRLVYRTDNIFPELFVMPRGLVTILLYLSIPAELALPGVGQNLLLFIILSTAGLMMLGLMASGRGAEIGQENPHLPHSH